MLGAICVRRNTYRSTNNSETCLWHSKSNVGNIKINFFVALLPCVQSHLLHTEDCYVHSVQWHFTLRCRRRARGGQGLKAGNIWPKIHIDVSLRDVSHPARTFHWILHQFPRLHLRDSVDSVDSVPSLANFPSRLPVLGAIGASRRKSLHCGANQPNRLRDFPKSFLVINSVLHIAVPTHSFTHFSLRKNMFFFGRRHRLFERAASDSPHALHRRRLRPATCHPSGRVSRNWNHLTSLSTFQHLIEFDSWDCDSCISETLLKDNCILCLHCLHPIFLKFQHIHNWK